MKILMATPNICADADLEIVTTMVLISPLWGVR